MTELVTNALPPRAQYLASGTQAEFPLPFPLLAAEDLAVWLDDCPSPLSWLVSGLGQASGGAITFSAPPPAGCRITLLRRMAIRRGTDFIEGGEFRARALNEELDRLTLLLLQVEEQARRSLRLPDWAPDAALELPAAGRANRLLGFDAAGLPALLGEGNVPEGPPGQPGPMGAMGPAGPQGAQGLQGAQGPAGAPGPQGVAGAAGPAGVQGLTGPQGAAGPAGPAGPQGMPGPMGPQGLQGMPGPQGVQGLMGPQGAAGQAFTPDVVGIFANRGLYDAQAPGFAYLATDLGQIFFRLGMVPGSWSGGVAFGKGDTGAQGPQGPVGPQGSAGPQGPQGVAGPQGLQGQKGLQWRGAWSSPAAYAVDDAVMLNGAAYVCVAAHTNAPPPGDGSKWQLLAAKGDAGPVGPAGAAGPAGATGAQGAPGPQGPAGAQGPVGATGAQGVAGPQGPAGAVGAAGPAGPTGAQGAAGLGLPAGGAVGYLLAKKTPADFEAEWVAVPAVFEQRLQFLERNLALTVLRSQIDAGWSLLKMVDGIADEFEDAAGIAACTGGTYDATGDYYSNETSGYGPDLITGAETYTASNQQYGAAANAADGNPATTWSPDNATSHWWQVQFPAARVIRRVKMVFTSGQTGSTGAMVQASADGASWSTLHSHAAPLVGGTSYVWDFTNALAFTRWRVVLTYAAANAPGVGEIEMFEALPPGSLTLTSIAFAADAMPAEARAVLLHQPLDAAVLNTDCTLEVSRDDGVSWTAGTLLSEGPFDAVTNILSAVIPLSAQPGGTSLKWRFRTFNAKTQRLHGVWLQWRT